MDYGEIVRRYREENKMTQKELAEKVQVSQAMITQIERGTKAISLQLATSIANVFDSDLSMFGEVKGG